jgi:hypothetical protein
MFRTPARSADQIPPRAGHHRPGVSRDRRSARRGVVPVAVGVALGLCAPALAQGSGRLHFTYLWHMEQPIYWPDRQPASFGPDRYETAWVSIQRKAAGATNPENNLTEIFGLPDRVAGYQHRMADSVWGFSFGRPRAGAQISYSGGLIENLRSLGNAGQLGYSPTWNVPLRNARAWTTLVPPYVPRVDIVLFPYHHALMPLLEPSTQRRQIQLYKEAYAGVWGTVPMSRGFFPSEMAFSERMIPILAAEGIEWTIVSAEKISRACADFPYVQGTGGSNMDPPNRADQLNPAQGASNYYRVQIDRGCSPAEAYPFALTPRRARYVDPATGAVSSIIVVPASQSLGWKDGYAPLGLSDFNALDLRNNPARPMLVVLAHDGDNAWGGGYSYYMEATPNLVASASAAGFVPTVIQQYLADHPVPANDFVKVEDGAWVNAEGDFGSPQFLNWNWPPVNAQGQVDIEHGWAEDIRNWAVITAMQNRVDTAEQMWLGQGQSVSIRNILEPERPGTNAVERAWHYFMGALNSGYMYYGTALDMEVKPAVACNNAARLIDPLLAAAPSSGPASDLTGPTVWIPQRHPWNPGSMNFGPQYGYRAWKSNGDFFVWTFVADVSGVQEVRLKWRLDHDGVMSLTGDENRTYAGGPGVGAWQSIPMTRRPFPAGNYFNDPTINFFVMPVHIADQYYARIDHLRNVLVDYYVEAVDTRGNITRSPIQHVWIGDGVGGLPPTPGGGGTPGQPTMSVWPQPPQAGQALTITYNPAGRPLAGSAQVFLHWGINGWQNIASPSPALTPLGDGRFAVTISLPLNACSVNFVFHNGSGTWDNNAGQDWTLSVTGCQQPPAPPPPWSDSTSQPDPRAALVAQNGARTLYAGVLGHRLYVSAPNAVAGEDAFVFVARQPGALRPAPWAKGGQVAAWDAFLAAESTNTFAGWFNANGGLVSGSAYQSWRAGTGGGRLSGTIDLAAHFGGAANVPRFMALAVANWQTPDAGALLPATQIPAAVTPNAALEAQEWVTIDLCALQRDPRVPPCCPADIAGTDGSPGADGQVNNGDFSLFIAAFFSADCTGAVPCNPADIATTGASPGADGAVDNGDFSLFISAFFAPCG